MTDDERDLVEQQLQEMEGEFELRMRDYKAGTISRDQFEMEHHCAVAKYMALRRYVIQDHDEFEKGKE
jgi:hypothetical protein